MRVPSLMPSATVDDDSDSEDSSGSSTPASSGAGWGGFTGISWKIIVNVTGFLEGLSVTLVTPRSIVEFQACDAAQEQFARNTSVHSIHLSNH